MNTNRAQHQGVSSGKRHKRDRHSRSPFSFFLSFFFFYLYIYISFPFLPAVGFIRKTDQYLMQIMDKARRREQSSH